MLVFLTLPLFPSLSLQRNASFSLPRPVHAQECGITIVIHIPNPPLRLPSHPCDALGRSRRYGTGDLAPQSACRQFPPLACWATAPSLLLLGACLQLTPRLIPPAMLARGLRPFVALAVLIVVLVLVLYRWRATSLSSSIPFQGSTGLPASSPETEGLPQHTDHRHSGYTEARYHEIFSASTPDRRYFKVDFAPRRGINPNAIPHPTLADRWVLVGQLDDHQLENSVWLAELVCTATFKSGVLSCIDSPLILSIGKTPVRVFRYNRDCEGKLTLV